MNSLLAPPTGRNVGHAERCVQAAVKSRLGTRAWGDAWMALHGCVAHFGAPSLDFGFYHVADFSGAGEFFFMSAMQG